jgi:hypothetical protein
LNCGRLPLGPDRIRWLDAQSQEFQNSLMVSDGMKKLIA